MRKSYIVTFLVTFLLFFSCHLVFAQVFTGEKTVLVIPVVFDTTSPTAPRSSREQIEQKVFGSTTGGYSLKGFLAENSKGKYTISGQAVDWIIMPYGSDPVSMLNEAKSRVRSLYGIEPDNYQNILLVGPFPFNSHVSSATGGAAFVANMVPQLHTIIHEYGHAALRLNHANSLHCSLDPDDPSKYLTIGTSGCQSVEYGDVYDIMGQGGHFSVANKTSLGWYNAGNIISVGESGSFVLEPSETNTSGPKVLVIPRGKGDIYGDNLYVEFRQPIGYDNLSAGLLEWNYNPYFASIHVGGYLIDASPNTADNRLSPTLVPGEAFVDPSTGTRVEIVSILSAQAFEDYRMNVNVYLGKTDLDGPTVSINNPVENDTVSGSINIFVNVTDQSDLAWVQLLVNGQIVETRLNPASGPQTFSLNTPDFPNGSSEIRVQSSDKSCEGIAGCKYNNVGSAAINVNFDNVFEDTIPPNVMVSSPFSPDPNEPFSFTNPVAVRTMALDFDTSVTSLQVFFDGHVAPDLTYTNNIQQSGMPSINKTEYILFPSGMVHTISAKALDFAGNEGVSTVASFRVDPDVEMPTAAITSPTNNQELSGSNLSLTADVLDNVWVDRIEFSLDDQLIGTIHRSFEAEKQLLEWDWMAPPAGGSYTLDWDSRSVANGTHALSVKAVDYSENVSAPNTISVNINNPNFPPVLNPIGNKNMTEGNLLYFTVGASDPNPGTILVYSASGLPFGAIFDASTHVFQWTPDNSQEGNYTLNFNVSDGTLTDSEQITITVTNVNRAPVLDAIGGKSVAEGVALSFTVSAADPDGDVLTYSATGLPTGAAFNPTTKTFSWTPGLNQAGDYSVTFILSDGSLTDSETVAITVTAPLVTLNIDKNGSGRNIGVVRSVPSGIDCGAQCSATFPRGTTVQLQAISNDPNVRLVSWSPCTGTGVCEITLNDTNNWVEAEFLDYSKSNLQIQTGYLEPSEGVAGQTVSINFLIKNWGAGPVVNGLLEVTISTTEWTYSNILPISSLASGAQEVITDSLSLTQIGAYNVNAYVRSDNDDNSNNNARTYTMNFDAPTALLKGAVVNDQDGLPLANVNIIISQDGQPVDTVTTDQQGMYSTSQALSAGTYELTPTSIEYLFAPNYIAYELQANTPLQPLNFEAAVNNQPPVLAAIGNKTVAENAALSFVINATDPNAIDILTYSATGLPAGATFNASTKTFNWTPTFTQSGSYPVVFTVSDGSLTVSEAVMITVTNVNQAPVLNTIGTKSVAEGVSLNFTVSASDVDGDTLTYAAMGLPSGAVFDPASRQFDWTPAVGQQGTYQIEFVVNDGIDVDNEVITVSVTPQLKADLLITSIQSPSPIATGTYVNIQSAVKNQGGGASVPTLVGFYLSLDATITASDIYIGQRSIGSLAAGAINSGTASIYIPPTIQPGTYYLGAIADYKNAQSEISETNNASVSPMSVLVNPGQDFTMTAVSGPTTAKTRSTITVNNAVKNIGPGNTGKSFSVGIYLSTDSNITTADRLIGTRSVSSLNSLMTSSSSTSLKLPSNLTAGTYYLGVIADYTNNTPEINETNNSLAGNMIVVTIQ